MRTDTDAWPDTAEAATALQRRLAASVETRDRFGDVRLVAGVDVGYDKRSDALCAGIVVLDAETLDGVDSVLHVDRARFPYVPGLFSFRELPPLLRAFERLTRWPDLVVCDGHGLAHPRRFGLACHLGVQLDLPSIGCAKTPHYGRCGEPGAERGATAPIVDDGLSSRADREHVPEGEGAETIGAVVRTQEGVNPLYVSPGHRVSLDTAVAWVLALAPRYRQPETTRRVDTMVNARVRGPA